MTEQLTKQVAEALNESNLALIRKIITVIGAERTQAFLAQTQETITQGGLRRKDATAQRWSTAHSRGRVLLPGAGEH
jgi:hypothetical protein